MGTHVIPESAWGAIPRATLMFARPLLSWHLLMGVVTGMGPAYSRRVTNLAAELRAGAAMNTKDAVTLAVGECRGQEPEKTA